MAKNGYALANRRKIEVFPTESTQVEPRDCGKVFLLDIDASSNYNVSLPRLGDVGAGWNAQFIVYNSGSGAVEITVQPHDDEGGACIKVLTLGSFEATTAASAFALASQSIGIGDRFTVVSTVSSSMEDARWYVFGTTNSAVGIYEGT